MNENLNKHRYCKECNVVVANVEDGYLVRLDNYQVVKGEYYCKNCAIKIKQ